MDPLYAYLQLTPENAKKFEQVNKYVPVEIFLGENYAESTFAIVIEDYEIGNYRFVNSCPQKNNVHNVHFEPNIQKPLKTIGDLNNLVKVFNGTGLTLRKEYKSITDQIDQIFDTSKKRTQEKCTHRDIEEIQGGQIERCRKCGKEW